MDSINLSFLLHNLIIVSNSLFFGLKITIPIIFILQFFKKRKPRNVIDFVIVSLNNMLLIGGLLFMITIVTNTFLAWYAGNEYEKEIILSSISGPKWFQYIFPVVNFALLPLILWFRKFRQTIIPSIYIVLFWIISTSLVEYFSKEEEFILHAHTKQSSFSLVEHLSEVLIFFVVFLIVYLFIKNKYRAIKFKDDE